jgi:hypothetical protein
MRIPTQEMPEVKNLVINGDPMKKHEVILARYAGKMILPDTTKGTYKSFLHELDALKTYDIPPRSADKLWELALERKKRIGAGNRMSIEVNTKDITGDLFNPHMPEDRRRYHYPGFDLTSTTKPTPLLYSAKESETPMLPIVRQLPILHGGEH